MSAQHTPGKLAEEVRNWPSDATGFYLYKDVLADRIAKLEAQSPALRTLLKLSAEYLRDLVEGFRPVDAVEYFEQLNQLIADNDEILKAGK